MATRRPATRAVKHAHPLPETAAAAAAAGAAPDARAPGARAVTSTAAVTRLGPVISIRSVAQVAGELRAALASGPLRLDAGAVEQIDTAGVQLLVATVASAAARGVAFEWAGTSAALHDAAAHLGLAAVLRLPAAARA